MMQKSFILYVLFAAIIASSGCDKEIPFNPQIHRAEAIVDGEPWSATAEGSFISTPPIRQSDSLVDDYLTIILRHTYPNEVDLERLTFYFPSGVSPGCHDIDLRSKSLFYLDFRGQKTYFSFIGSELDGLREFYTPDTARVETSTICITKLSVQEQLVEGTFDLYLKTEDGLLHYDDANRPSEFSIQNGTFSAHLAE